MEWGGDVDLGDGALQKKHAEYTKRLQLVENLKMKSGDWSSVVLSKIQSIYVQLEEHGIFITSSITIFSIASVLNVNTFLLWCF